jgi:ABC-type branched-subunit amino acid transport system ATPase component
VPESLLAVAGLRKTFGGVRAVDDCSFAVPAGTVTGLIGPNGSGKTTVFNIVTGYLRADAGRVFFAGHDITRYGTGRRHRLGLSRTFQQARVFPGLTVLENLVVAGGLRWWRMFGRRVDAGDARRARDLLDEFHLAPLAGAPAAELSYGQRKLLEFAAVLMSSPRLVLLDEPTAGVNPVLAAAMERHIRDRHAAGVTFLVVEHDMAFVMRLCDPVVVLDAGRPVMSGPPRQVRDDPRVLDAYLGA